MDRDVTISQLKAMLLKDVAYLCRRDDLLWTEPIVRTLREIREAGVQAVLFGGTLRSLLLSRLRHQRLGRPRDLDIVVAGSSLDELRERFRASITRETRFGGLVLERMNWHFDVWPLQRTWAFLQDDTQLPRFSALPFTTFFNLEAIAVDVWTSPGRPRAIYSGDDQFFKGIILRTLEINHEDNPFPALCIVRSLIMAWSTGFSMGPRLARYLMLHGPTISDVELEDTQRRHYGQIRCDVNTMRRWLDHLAERHTRNSQSTVVLPIPYQRRLWPEEEDGGSRLNLHILADST
jgi:hypothetical protein